MEGLLIGFGYPQVLLLRSPPPVACIGCIAHTVRILALAA